MKVIAFIREKKRNLQNQNDQFIAKLEPKFKNLSNFFNDKITIPLINTLNNPWFSHFGPTDSDEPKKGEALEQIPEVKKMYQSLVKKLILKHI